MAEKGGETRGTPTLRCVAQNKAWPPEDGKRFQTVVLVVLGSVLGMAAEMRHVDQAMGRLVVEWRAEFEYRGALRSPE